MMYTNNIKILVCNCYVQLKWLKLELKLQNTRIQLKKEDKADDRVHEGSPCMLSSPGGHHVHTSPTLCSLPQTLAVVRKQCMHWKNPVHLCSRFTSWCPVHWKQTHASCIRCWTFSFVITTCFAELCSCSKSNKDILKMAHWNVWTIHSRWFLFTIFHYTLMHPQK